MVAALTALFLFFPVCLHTGANWAPEYLVKEFKRRGDSMGRHDTPSSGMAMRARLGNRGRLAYTYYYLGREGRQSFGF